MAAAIVPLIAGIAPELISLIVSLAHPAAKAAESMGTGTGAVKMATVFSDVMDALNKAAAAGTISKQLPADDTVKLILQSVVTSMKMGGMLIPDLAPTPPASQIQLKAGQTLTVTVAP